MKKLVITCYSLPQALFAVSYYSRNGWKMSTANDDFPKSFGLEYRLTMVKDDITGNQPDQYQYTHVARYYKDDVLEDTVAVDPVNNPIIEEPKRQPGRPRIADNQNGKED